MSATWEIRAGDARKLLLGLPDASVQCCVTSPPYYGLRDYRTGVWHGGDSACDHVQFEVRTGKGLAEWSAIHAHGGGHKAGAVDGLTFREVCGKCGARREDKQIGLERSPQEYVGQLVAIFREVRRVLRDDGTVWLNIGDSYATRPGRGTNVPQTKHPSNSYPDAAPHRSEPLAGIKAKDLLGIPWMLAFALREDGWYLRSDIVWAKPNAMPESVTDRPTSAHEHVFLLAKSERYFYDAFAIREDSPEDEQARTDIREASATDHLRLEQGYAGKRADSPHGTGRNKRNVWEVATVPYAEAHFAVFPPKLVEPCILAGTSPYACEVCGAPWGRVTERGWEPTCAHGDYRLDDFEVIPSPTGAGGLGDPSLVSGRAGMNRPRDENGGRRLITRYQQRHYAEQLRSSEHRAAMAAAAGEAFAHYIRTDRSGARPVPEPLLEDWITRGWLERVEPAVPPVPTDKRRCLVLDPFAGAGTTGVVALRLERSFVGLELNPEYAEIARQRIRDDAPLMNTIAEVAA